MVRFSRLIGFCGLGLVVGEGVLTKVGERLVLSLAGELRFQIAASPEELVLIISTIEVSLLASSDFGMFLVSLLMLMLKKFVYK